MGIPCIWTRNSVFILRADSDSLSDLDEQSESTSSMKMMLGLCCLASSNRFLTSFSDSPSHLDTRSDEETEKKVELLASVATAFAKYDFPVPGGWKQNQLLLYFQDVISCFSITININLHVYQIYYTNPTPSKCEKET